MRVISPPSTIEWAVTTRPESWDTNWIDSRADDRVQQWTWLRQPHGNVVVTVTEPGEHRGASADGVVTNQPGATLVIRTADCAPVLLVGRTQHGETVLGLAHAGWRGLVDGVLSATASALRSLGAKSIDAWLGPCIGPECYEFGPAELANLASELDSSVCALTSWGTPALDMIAAVNRSLEVAMVNYQGLLPGWTCTACDAAQRYSHRARHEAQRMALIASIR
jgi:polyphenol oxidase